MEPLFYMEYKESRKIVLEMFIAYYKYQNLKAWGPFKISDIKAKAEEKTQKRWKEIKMISRKERTVQVEFYEDSFSCVTGDVKQEYRYDELEAICETDTTFVLVAGKKRKKDAFLGLKKGSVKGRSLADLKAFLLEKCPKITKIIYLE